jgi:hypothetical protein
MQTCWCFHLSAEELVLAKRSIRSFSGHAEQSRSRQMTGTLPAICCIRAASMCHSDPRAPARPPAAALPACGPAKLAGWPLGRTCCCLSGSLAPESCFYRPVTIRSRTTSGRDS